MSSIKPHKQLKIIQTSSIQTERFTYIRTKQKRINSENYKSLCGPTHFKYIYEVHTISFQTFFLWALLLPVHIWNSSLLRSNLLRLQFTCCTVPTSSGRPYGSPLVWACQWPWSQPLSSPQLSHNYRSEPRKKPKVTGSKVWIMGGWGTVLMPILVK